jgi:carbamoylphosphate synthase large subunit
MKTVIVTGIGGPAGRSVSELLAQRGYRVVGLDMQVIDLESIPFYQVPAALDGRFLDELHQIAQKEKPSLIIPTVTEELPVLAGGWQWDADFPLLISPASGINIANDKYLTSQALEANNVNVPRYALPSQIESSEALAEKIGWPCISKPRVGRGGRGVVVRSEKDFTAIRELKDDHILQEFAAGTDYAPNVYVGHGQQCTAVTLEKTELKEGLVGNAKSVVRVPASDVEQLAVRAALALGLKGPIDVDIRRLQDGSPVVLEVNARFGANILSAPEIFDRMLEDFLQV